MTTKNVLVEMRRQPGVESGLFAMQLGQGPDFSAAVSESAAVRGLSLDPSFPPVSVPALGAAPTGTEATAAMAHETVSLESEFVLVRGTIDESELADDMFAAGALGSVTAIYADPVIQSFLTCVGSEAVGTASDVARAIGVPHLSQAAMDGRGVLIAIVDNGINLAHLRSRGLDCSFSAERSWTPVQPPGIAPLVPGNLPVGHGTMCAFDALIAAPRATLLDVAVLRSQRSSVSAMDGLLSDAVLGYAFLLRVLREMQRPGDFRSLVVSNSWGMFQQSWDLPPGHSGNYSHNPAHPFNRIVSTLERAGADILFAAGNCGRECPDGRCGSEVDAGIYGANSHPSVLSVAGVDLNGRRVGYSTRGPGHLDRQKPDLCGYTHFDGSGVYPADGGTSAATPVVAGLLAAFRSRFPSGPDRTPSALRDLIRGTARKLGTEDFDLEHGFGLVDGLRLARSALPPTASNGSSDEPRDRGDVKPRSEEREGIMDNNDREFMEALRAFGSPDSGGSQMGGGGQQSFGSGGGFGGAQGFGGNADQDQEFMQALAAFGDDDGGGGGGDFGADGFQGGFGGGGGGGGGFGEMQGSGGSDEDREFLQALAAFGGGGAGAMGGMGEMGGGQDVTAAPSLGALCGVYRKVRPVVSGILRFVRVIPGVGPPAATAIRTLMGVLDAVCGGRGSLSQLCQVWRRARPVVVGIVRAIGAIPFIGRRAARAIRSLISALDAACR